MFQCRFDHDHVLPMSPDVFRCLPLETPDAALRIFPELGRNTVPSFQHFGKDVGLRELGRYRENIYRMVNGTQVHREVDCRLKRSIGQWATNTPKASSHGREWRTGTSNVPISFTSHGSAVAFNPHESEWKNMLCLRHVRSPSFTLERGMRVALLARRVAHDESAYWPLHRSVNRAEPR